MFHVTGLRCACSLALLVVANLGVQAQSATQLKITAPTRMINDKTLTLKAELLDQFGNVDWKTWVAFGTVSARRVSDQSEIPVSITYFEDHAGIPPADSIRFYNGKGSVSLTLDNGECEAPGDIEVSVSVLGLLSSAVVTVLHDPPLRTLSGALSGADLIWGPGDGVIHITGDISWGSGDLTIAPGTLVMIDRDRNIDVSGNRRVVATGTQDDPIYVFPTTGSGGMVLPNVCAQCDGGERANELAWGQIRHSGSGHSVYEHVILVGGGNGGSEGHTRPPVLRFQNSASFDITDCVFVDNPGKSVYGVGNGTYNITRTLFARDGHGSEFTGGGGFTLNIIDTWYTGVGRGPGTVSCGGQTFDCGFDGDLINPRVGSNILISGCILTDGGDEAIDNSTAQLTLENTIIYGVRDRAYADDGGGAHLTMNNCLVFGNGGAFGGSGAKTVSNSTIFGGGGLGGSNNLVENSIIWPQTLNGCPGTFNYNLLGPGTTVGCGAGNISNDPLFGNSSGPSYDFNPQSISPAVTAGSSGGRVGWLGFPEPNACSVDGDCGDSNACTVDVCDAGACRSDPIDGCIPCDVDSDCNIDPQCPGGCLSGECSYGGVCDDGLACTVGDSCFGGQCRGSDTCLAGESCSALTGSCIIVPTTLTFQQGVDGYADTSDTFIFQELPDASYGGQDYVEWDGQESTSPPGLGTIIGLIRFDEIFGTGPGQIPVAGEEITSATLQYNTFDVGDDAELREVRVAWGEDLTWNTLGVAPGPQEDDDYGPILGFAPGSLGDAASFNLNVTASIQEWADDPTKNNGWILIPTGTNGAEFYSSEFSTDVTLRPKLTVVYGGSEPLPNVIRQPYLQMGTPTSMTIVWRTDFASDSRVSFGTVAGNLDQVAIVPDSVTNHVVTVSGLTPNTTYYYEVGSSTQFHAGGCEQHYFKTSPDVGSPTPFSIWAVGDSGGYTPMQLRVRDAMQSVAGADQPELFFHLGDIAYENGGEDEYTLRHFAAYEEVLNHTVNWPTLGNRDANSSDSPSQSGPYYRAFVLPTSGEAGGLASGTEAYYSFDYGNVHFICLDSHDTDRSPGSPMLTWLAADLAATDAQWLVAFWHHPPYSRGSHDSDFYSDSGGRLVDMRENVLPMLEARGVDLVLGGHSHLYERSYLIDGVYGYGAAPDWKTPAFSTLQANGDIVDAGDGTPSYVKSPGIDANEGAVYVVAGHGGRSLDCQNPTSCSSVSQVHPVMQHVEIAYGSVLIEVDGNRLTAVNIRQDGVVTDTFGIDKSCVSDAECQDLLFCNGSSACVAGDCVAGASPCPGQSCDEVLDVCVDCLLDGDCDDGEFCTGAETCDPGGSCLAGTPPCAAGEVCDEATDQCQSSQCVDNLDCDDSNLCTDDSCNAGVCE